MAYTPEILRIYFDLLDIPFLLRGVPQTNSKYPALQEIDGGFICRSFLRGKPSIKFEAEYPSETNRQVRDYLHDRLGKVVRLRGSEWELGRGVLTGLSFTIPFPLLDTEPYSVAVLLDDWTPNLIGRG